MNGVLPRESRLLFGAALMIFVVTIVIGILNGLDVWDPPHNLLLTHVHAGTLGWITLSVVGAAMAIFGESTDAKTVESRRRLAMAVVAAAVIYVTTFALTTSVVRPIAGTLMLAAIVWVLVWVWGAYRVSQKRTYQFATLLAVISLTLGAVLGVLLGLFIANGSLPGLSNETAGNLAGAHPPAMLIGYLILAGVAITDWLLDGPPGKLGRVVPWGLFLSGLLTNVAIIANNEALIQVATLLEVIAIVLYLVRMWSRIKPAAWAGAGSSNFARLSVVFLAVGMGLFVYVVSLFISGQLDPETGEGGVGVLIAFDHAFFIGVMTNALFGTLSMKVTAGSWQRLVMWGTNVGLIGFLVGLVTESAILKRISTPIMGASLLVAIFMFVQQLGSSRAAPATA